MRRGRVAATGDFEEITSLLEAHPVEGVAVADWLQRYGRDALRWKRVWLYGDALCFSGANLLPVNADDAAARVFARLAAEQGRMCSSIVGRLPATATLWRELEPSWGPAREIRSRQVVMVSDGDCPVTPDPQVREAGSADFDAFYQASIEMYIEEIGASPIAHDGGHAYRSRISELIGNRVAYVRTDGDRVVFKAELGAVTPRCAQLQGVWVHPDLRGNGVGTAGTARVLELARKRGVGTIALAVNDFNSAARYAYEQCGFREIADQMVVLF